MTSRVLAFGFIHLNQLRLCSGLLDNDNAKNAKIIRNGASPLQLIRQQRCLATRVAKPRDKATVEKAVDLAYKRIYAPLRDKVFYSLEELRNAVKQCLHEHNHALFQKKDLADMIAILKRRLSSIISIKILNY